LLLQKFKGAVHGSLSLVQIVTSRQYARSIRSRRMEASVSRVSHFVRVPGWLAFQALQTIRSSYNLNFVMALRAKQASSTWQKRLRRIPHTNRRYLRHRWYPWKNRTRPHRVRQEKRPTQTGAQIRARSSWRGNRYPY